MDIIDKLDTKISNKKKDTEDKEKIKSDIKNKIYRFHDSIYEKYFSKEFNKLEKLFKKHIKKDKDISTSLSKNSHFLEIDITFTMPEYSSRAIKIQLIDRKAISYFPDDEIKELREYKFLENNFCLKVSKLGDYNSDYHERDEISHKNFEIADKEKAYNYLTELFQKEILPLDALD